MKRKRFYDNKNRGQKWTEKPVGRKIYFADKYVSDGTGDNKYNKQEKTKKPFFTKEKGIKLLKALITLVLAFAIINVGYIVTDVYIDRHSMPSESESDDSADLENIILNIKGSVCQPMSLDGGVMLSAVIDTASDSGYTSLAFDLKRSDGTIGYESALATIAAYGAVSSPSSSLEESVTALNENDIMPIGIIFCYKDNIVPAADLSCAVFSGGDIYEDSGGSTYLNPGADGTYSYIKSILEEAVGMGVTVFLLDNYDLPDDVSDGYNDGFDYLAEKLYNDFSSDIKLLKAVDFNLTADNAKSLETEWEEKTQYIEEDENTVFYITAQNPTLVKQFLDNNSITNYIISE